MKIFCIFFENFTKIFLKSVSPPEKNPGYAHDPLYWAFQMSDSIKNESCQLWPHQKRIYSFSLSFYVKKQVLISILINMECHALITFRNGLAFIDNTKGTEAGHLENYYLILSRHLIWTSYFGMLDGIQIYSKNNGRLAWG